MNGLMLTTHFAGQIVGASAFGYVSDQRGRRIALGLSLLLAACAAAAGAVSQTYAMLLVSTFLLGIGVGGNLPVVSTLLAECCPAARRGKLSIALSASWSIGKAAISVAAWWLLPRMSCKKILPTMLTDEAEGLARMKSCNLGWRYLLAGLGACVALVFLLLLSVVVESPAQLVMQGKLDEAERILRYMARLNGVDADSIPYLKALSDPAPTDSLPSIAPLPAEFPPSPPLPLPPVGSGDGSGDESGDGSAGAPPETVEQPHTQISCKGSLHKARWCQPASRLRGDVRWLMSTRKMRRTVQLLSVGWLGA